MIVRRATSADVPVLVTMAAAFLHETPFSVGFPANQAYLSSVVEYVLEHGSGFLACTGRFHEIPLGCVGTVVVPYPLNGEPFADVMLLYVDRQWRGSPAGRRLLMAAEDWALTKGAVMVKISAPAGRAGQRLGNYFERRPDHPDRKFQRVETVFVRYLDGRPTWTEETDPRQPRGHADPGDAAEDRGH